MLSRVVNSLLTTCGEINSHLWSERVKMRVVPTASNPTTGLCTASTQPQTQDSHSTKTICNTATQPLIHTIHRAYNNYNLIYTKKRGLAT